MTTATTVLGMVKWQSSTGQGSEMWRPMAIAVIGGLSISTILTLILIPVLYCVFAGTGIKRQRKVMKRRRSHLIIFKNIKVKLLKMKSVFITFDQAYYEQIIETLDRLNCRGFSYFEQE